MQQHPASSRIPRSHGSEHGDEEDHFKIRLKQKVRILSSVLILFVVGTLEGNPGGPNYTFHVSSLVLVL